jgi:hypothetical protein
MLAARSYKKELVLVVSNAAFVAVNLQPYLHMKRLGMAHLALMAGDEEQCKEVGGHLHSQIQLQIQIQITDDRTPSITSMPQYPQTGSAAALSHVCKNCWDGCFESESSLRWQNNMVDAHKPLAAADTAQIAGKLPEVGCAWNSAPEEAAPPDLAFIGRLWWMRYRTVLR